MTATATLTADPSVMEADAVLAQFQDPLIHLLLAAVAIALVAWWIEGRSGWPVAPLALDQWLVCAAIASGVLVYSELRKLVSRVWGR